MRDPSRFEIWYGRDEPPVETRELKAGPLAAQLEGIDLRYVHIGGVEAVRRLFVAVRDAAWGTIPPRVSNLEVEVGSDAFRVSFEALHEAGDLRFRWRGDLAGGADGTLDCLLDGTAESDFEYNRIGFCVLHPRENAGRRYRARTPDGDLAEALPDLIGPQRFEDGKLWPLFPSYDRLEIEVEDGLWARFEFEGDLFEMEDQRNWTDASFKTYSTPITLGWPYRARAGQQIRQRVRLTFEGAEPPSAERGGPIRIELGEPTGKRLPELGLGMASHGDPLSEREAELLRLLRLDHLRVDLRVGEEGWEAKLARAAEDARAVGASLELALFLADEPKAQLEALGEALVSDPDPARVSRFIVFKDGEVVTRPEWVRLARERLGGAFPWAAFAGGTNAWFTELNRERPELGDLDAVVYSVNATVHADDDTSVVETPAAQGDTVRSALALSDGLPVIVGPVTIRPRSWPFGSYDSGELPFQVDPRQCSLLGAGWTLASVKHLSEAGAASFTYFETTGWRGVIETEAGPPRPDLFPSRAGAPFPLFHVLADVAEWKEGEIVEARSSAPLAVEGFALHADGGLHVLLANLTASEKSCAVGPLPAERASVRRVDETTVADAGERPMEFRTAKVNVDAPGGSLALELAPYAVVRIDA